MPFPKLNTGFYLSYSSYKKSFQDFYEHSFVLEYNSKNLVISHSTEINITKHNNDQVILITYSENIDSINKNEIIENYKSKSYNNKLDNLERTSVVLVDLVKQKIVLISDRLSSKKLFYGNLNSDIIVTTEQKTLKNFNLNIQSVLWYLTNGSLINDQSLFKNLYQITNAEIVEISDKTIKKEKYWELSFNPIKKNKDEAINILSEKLEQAIDTSYKELNSNYISLSGGYDISLILAIINKKYGNSAKCFTYYYNKITEKSDAYVAEKQAQMLNHRLQSLTSYKGNFDDFISLNSNYGDGRANICDEVNFWLTLHNLVNKQEKNFIYTGEEFFGWSASRQTNHYALLKGIGLKNSGNLKTLGGIIDKELCLNQTIDEIFNSLIVDSPNFDNSLDFQQYWYFYHNLPNILLPWREQFAGAIFTPVMPWLSNDLIDFITHLPAEYRNKKSLFKSVAHKTYPDLFSINRAIVSNNKPSWSNEILKNENYIKNSIYSFESSIDAYIIPNQLIDITIDKLRNQYSYKNKLARYRFKIAEKFPAADKILSLLIDEEQIDLSYFLIRYLVLRQFLKK